MIYRKSAVTFGKWCNDHRSDSNTQQVHLKVVVGTSKIIGDGTSNASDHGVCEQAGCGQST